MDKKMNIKNNSGLTDLHLHTTASDGTYPPEKMVKLASERGFTTISITDHDTTEGIDEAKIAGNIYGVDVISGIELTVEYMDFEMHILGYYINKDNDDFQNFLMTLRDIRLNRAQEMADKLKTLGYSIPIDNIIQSSEKASLGRLHIANSLISAGHVQSIEEAMSRFLRKGRPAYVPKKRIHPIEGIDLIKNIGGIAVIAHPGLANLERFFEDLIKFGIDGIEVFHTKHSPSQSERYLKFAEENKLLVTGGSDCHGLGKETELLGAINLPEKYLKQIKDFYFSRNYHNS